MKNGVEFIPSGSVTSPAGFQAGATGAGIKKKSGLDLGILSSEVICVTAGMFTTNRVKAAPVILCQQRLRSGKARAVVVNSGGANACTGERGLVDGEEMAALAAGVVGAAPEEVLVASTGVIGRPLPMARLRVGMGQITLSRDGGHELARAIMTTDTVPKEAAVGVEGSGVIIGGAVKGSGMIHPDLATLLCFLTTDASVELDFLRSALRRAVDKSFNMVSVDTDTSTNDTVLILANGRAGGKTITRGGRQAGAFQQALDKLCIHLAKATARDGEGATRLIEVIINGAPGLAEARLVARAIVSSSLVKSAVHGSDPNWGRILAAVGWSGVEVVLGKIELYIGDICLVRDGCPLPFNEAEVVQVLKGNEVPIALNLNLGNAAATAWGCDLSEEYVTINSQYMT
ncbi:MAG: bifunctional glutamate N-acetyltransferase/amino-acid acetyltransferase ArgJ [Dehalococcoidales bacterium]|jgi:glutamate N-acetyltransferase/amino-acid N-acetyltransferase|nr:bifunctional ornithine acetyltransferase/N-acetylglutamate synthase [Dehalococcoidales bacterium]MDP6043487.1 bifunctional glutamate N-acetyltransferase/amino-acid acetyltransferase ArgJ [Dehalococcoidales bacterium]MDP6576922.1 bifunctional glutamate N-acetyltransferase/amino-acid acetyltransferase ArgJ [Dehalococcoidales bacterium]MDP7415325.1 bifunctional glutamate N-acetyltransferase/amino-acid acetyltransferase ArgJ [Dehalococcoidales bacterium]